MAILIPFVFSAPKDWLTNPQFIVPFVSASIVLFLSASVLGRYAALTAYRLRDNPVRMRLVGVRLAWTCVLLAPLVGCLPNVLMQSKLWNLGSFTRNFFDFVFKPTFWICFVGFIPATILGIYFSRRINRAFTILRD